MNVPINFVVMKVKTNRLPLHKSGKDQLSPPSPKPYQRICHPYLLLLELGLFLGGDDAQQLLLQTLGRYHEIEQGNFD